MSSKKLPKIRSRNDAVSYFATHQRVKGYDMQVQRAHALSWNCDGTRIACGSQDKRVAIAQVDSSCRARMDSVVSAHADSVDQVAFQHNSPYMLASASTDKSICVWDVRQAKAQTKLSTKAPNLFVTWSPCGRYLVYGDRDDKVHIVDGRTLTSMKMHDFKIETNEFVYHPNGKYLFVATGGGKVEIFNMPDLEPLCSVQAHSAQSICLSLAVSRDGTRLAVGGNDALASFWDIDQMICDATVARLDYPVRSCSFSYDGQMVALGSEDHMIDIAWSEDGQKVADVRVDAEVFSVAWHPRLPILAYAAVSTDGRDRDNLRLWGFTS